MSWLVNQYNQLSPYPGVIYWSMIFLKTVYFNVFFWLSYNSYYCHVDFNNWNSRNDYFWAVGMEWNGRAVIALLTFICYLVIIIICIVLVICALDQINPWNINLISFFFFFPKVMGFEIYSIFYHKFKFKKKKPLKIGNK